MCCSLLGAGIVIFYILPSGIALATSLALTDLSSWSPWIHSIIGTLAPWVLFGNAIYSNTGIQVSVHAQSH